MNLLDRAALTVGSLIVVAVYTARGTYRWLTGYRDPYRRRTP